MFKRIAILMIFLALLPCKVYATVSAGWERHVISAQYRPIYLYVKDIDRDGNLDVVSTTNQHPGLFNSEVAWFRNNLKQGLPWDKFIIDSATGSDPITNANGVVVADIDGDGYEDVIVATGIVTGFAGGVYWYKAPTDPTGAWQRFTIEEGTFDSYFKIYAMDANGDGRMDLVVGGRQGVVIFLNPGNPALPGAVWPKINLPYDDMGSSIYLDDINGDGRLDILNTLLYGNVSWTDVLYAGGQFTFNRTMINPDHNQAFDVNALNVNGDSKKDVLVTTFMLPNIYWYENPSNPGDPWIQHLVTNSYAGSDLYTGDINRDGKTDFVVSGLTIKKISWFEFRWENGQALWTEHLVDDNINEPGDISLDDLDGDGDLDVVVCGQKEDQMIWYENKLNETPTTTTMPISTTTSAPATIVSLIDFTAIPGNRTVTLVWSTASEINNAGFNLYRSEIQNGTYKKINTDIIPSQGSSTQGGSYKFIDKEIQNRKTYYYKLEDIDNSGLSTFHGPVSATPRLIYGWGNK